MYGLRQLEVMAYHLACVDRVCNWFWDVELDL